MENKENSSSQFIDKARSVLKSLPDQDRSDFISNFNKLDSDEKRSVAVDRLISNFEKQSQPQKQGSILDVFPQSLNEFNRGFYNASSRALEGVGQALSITPLGNFYGQGSEAIKGGVSNLAEASKNTAESIPESPALGNVSKAIYNMAGETAPVMAEFLVTKRALNGFGINKGLEKAFGKIEAVDGLTDSVAMGVQTAVHEFRKNNGDLVDSLRAGSNAATFGMGLPIVSKAIPIVKEHGSKAAEAFIEGVTGSAEAAKDFVRNMSKYNINIFKGVKNPEELKKLNDLKMKDMKAGYDSELYNLQTKHAIEKNKFDSDIENSNYKIFEANKTAKESINESGRTRLEDVKNKSAEAFKASREASENSASSHTKQAVEQMELKRKYLGNSVDASLEAILDKDPSASIDTEYTLSRLLSIIKEPKNGLDIVNGKIVPTSRLSAFEKADIKMLQDVIDDYKSNINSRGIPLGFAQKYKRIIQEVAFNGEPTAVKHILKKISRDLDPARAPESAIIGSNIKDEVAGLGKANRDFSEFKQSYDEAKDLLTKTDASGNAIADHSSAFNKFMAGDRFTIGQIAKIDKQLPPEAKLLPKFEAVKREIARADSVKTSTIKLAQKKISSEKIEFNKQISQKEFKIKQAINEKKFAKARELRDQLNAFKLKKQAEIDSSEKLFNDEYEFLRNQKYLRSFFASGRLGNIQTAGVLGAASQIKFPNPVTGAMSAIGGLGFSPVIASNSTKFMLPKFNAGMDALGGILRSRATKPLIVEKFINHEPKNSDK